MFGTGAHTNYDRNVEKTQLGSQADWMAQGAMTKTQNTGMDDAYRRRQNELSSQVLEQTNYKGYQPEAKTKFEEVDNFGR